MSEQEAVPGRLPAVERDTGGTVRIEGRGRYAANMGLEDLRWLCVVAGPAVLAGASRIERLAARED